jgi:hypothetical protein
VHGFTPAVPTAECQPTNLCANANQPTNLLSADVPSIIIGNSRRAPTGGWQHFFFFILRCLMAHTLRAAPPFHFWTLMDGRMDGLKSI